MERFGENCDRRVTAFVTRYCPGAVCDGAVQDVSSVHGGCLVALRSLDDLSVMWWLTFPL